MRTARRMLAGALLLASVAPLGAQAPEQPGGPKAPARRRAVLVLPFLNQTGKPELSYWQTPLALLTLSQLPPRGVFATGISGNATLVAAFASGELSAERPADRIAALRAVGGDCVLVSAYKRDGDNWVFSGTAYDATRPDMPALDTVTTSHENPYVAGCLYLDEWAPKLGGNVGDKAEQPGAPGVAPAQPAAGGAKTPGKRRAPTKPPKEQPAAPPAAGGEGEPAKPPAAGPQPPPPPPPTPPGAQPGAEGAADDTEVIEELNIDCWARGVHAWPYTSPREAWRGDLDAALAWQERQLRVEPRFPLAYTAAAVANIAAGQPERGMQIQRAWTESQPPNVIDQHNLGVVLAAAGRTDEAAAAFAKALEAPGGPLPMDAVALVAAYVDAKRYDDAVAMVRKLQAAFGSVRDMHLLHGRALLALGNSRDAVDPLQNAMAMSPYTLDGYQALVEAYVARRFWSGVEKTAKAAAQALPDLPAAWLFLAQCQTTMGNGAGALDTAQRAARHWPKSSLVLQALAEAHLATGNPAGAVAACDASVASDPRNNAARRLRARAQLQAGDTDAALKAADDALRHATRGDMGETAREAARVRFYRGEYPQCLALLKLSEEYEPNRPDVAMLRAMVNLYGGDQEAAWRGFLAALDFDRGGTATAEALNVVYAAANEKPPVTVAMVMLATVWERTGKVMEARDQYRRYRMAEPKGFLVRYVEERLEATKTKGR